jgi:hypothetical protein
MMLKLPTLLLLFAVCFAQAQTRAPFIIVSEPDSSAVYSNGIFRGTTPLALSDTHSVIRLSIRRSGFLPFDSSISRETMQTDSVRTTLSPASVLQITSSPTNAVVYIDSVRYGRTPIVIDTVLPRTVQLTVVKDHHRTYSEFIVLEQGTTVTRTLTLEPLVTTAVIMGSSSQSIVVLDNKPVPYQDGERMTVMFGGHLLEVRDTVTGLKASHVFLVSSKAPLLFNARMNYFSPFKTAMGILAPGYNQRLDEQIDKSNIIAGTAIAGGAFMAYALYRHSSALSEFHQAQKEYSLSGNANLADRNRRRMKEEHDHLRSATSLYNFAQAFLAIVWSVNAADVILNHRNDCSIEQSTGRISAGTDPRTMNGVLLTYQRTF